MSAIEHSWCSDCGWMLPVAHRFLEGRKEIVLCAECVTRRETLGMPTKAQPQAKSTIAETEQKPFFADKQQRLCFVVGLLTGIAVGVSIAYNILKLLSLVP